MHEAYSTLLGLDLPQPPATLVDAQRRLTAPPALLYGMAARLRKYKDYLEKTTDTDQNYEEVQVGGSWRVVGGGGSC